MKLLKLILIICTMMCFQACYKNADIRIQNGISRVKIEQVNWGGTTIATELLPGQTSARTTINRYEEKLPAGNKITFIMTANGRTVFLETVDIYMLEQDDDVLILLNDDTPVTNLNE